MLIKNLFFKIFLLLEENQDFFTIGRGEEGVGDNFDVSEDFPKKHENYGNGFQSL